MRKLAVTLVAGGLGILITILSPAMASATLLNLGPEQIVLAGGEDLIVPGYSVPCFMDFDSDGLKDLLVGEGGSGFDGKIRVYLNSGSATTPQFSDFSYVQSDSGDLVVPGSGCMGAFPRVAHFDDDGKKDLLVGRADGTVQLFRNVGTDTAPTFDGGALIQAGPAGVKSPINVGYYLTNIQVPGAPFPDVLGNDRSRAAAFYRSWYAYLERKGWEERAYLYMFDEPLNPDDYEKVRRLGATPVRKRASMAPSRPSG
jgi:hypothetical protein